MKMVQASDGTLELSSFELGQLLFGLGAVALLVGRAVWPGASRPPLLWYLVLVPVALLLLSAVESNRFVFDPRARRLRWTRRTFRRRSSGEVAFEEITGLSLEQAWNEHGSRSNARRIVVHTSSGVLPLSRSYSGFGQERMRLTAEAIRRVVAGAQRGRAVPLTL